MFSNTAKKSLSRRTIYYALPVISLTVMVCFYSYMAAKMPLLLPNGEELWGRFLLTFTKPIKGVSLAGHLLASLKRVLISLIFAWTLGIGFGVMIGWNRTLKAIFGSIFDLFRPIPPIAWIPIIIMWFGIGEFPKVLIVFIGSFIPVVLNTEAGIRMVDKESIAVATVFGANKRQMLMQFVIPTALPSIFAGVRTSVSCGWTVVLAAEMLGADSGVGSLVTRGWNASDMALVLVSIICIGLIGAVLAFTLNKAEKVICPWNN
ncbi:MAG: ABC transporter permease [Synergistaceae bacterium]|jgi:ABC-type nitrate/sulfonate/bicarbonate transport system permease component|nr:ABC transporter permease [Synergistaceae bacterium]